MPIDIVEIKEESWFKIPNIDSFRPFFMSIVSDSNHWMFISSNGGLTAGRKNAEHALFPYYSDDKITELSHTTGCKTIFRVKRPDGIEIWEPFSNMGASEFKITRNLYKNRWGNKIMFEEINHDLELSFSYQWNSSNLFGFLRTATLKNQSEKEQNIEVLDGFQNILPYGVDSDLQKKQSNLVDAYKRTELLKDAGIGIYALSAIIIDRAEPSEALKANTVWSRGLENPTYLLSSLQLENFREGNGIKEELDKKGERGAYLVKSSIELSSAQSKAWYMVANVNQSQSDLIALRKTIKENDDLLSEVFADVELGTKKLKTLVCASDGLELTADKLRDTRHYANVLFNIMRGGIFDNGYQIEKKDFTTYLKNSNKEVYKRNQDFLKSLNEEFDKFSLIRTVQSIDDADLSRLSEEYLPLKFSRRHGDPSRPWNKFSINTRSEVDGSKILDYEGNWRDIFQNWEALAHSYPEFIEGMISKFLNASTFDGYNPYRITKGGFDWEVVEPEDPWSFIGYWGDHQIIYLLKFLEFHKNYHPQEFKKLFSKSGFVYANVPYRIKPYDQIVKHPKDTIEFDVDADKQTRASVAELGADGALLGSKLESIYHVGFTEKILATVLAKISNFIPEAGIWLNTQRPEWNDANNALVGNGVSMVTLYYLRRFLNFLQPVIAELEGNEVMVSEHLVEMFSKIKAILNEHKAALVKPIGSELRKTITDGLGKAGSAYRETIYKNGFSGEKSSIAIAEIGSFIDLALEYLEHSIRANKREDNLYHAYNLMSMDDSGVTISRLPEMLEGQVAALSSGSFDAEESLQVLNALRASALYRKDQNSYILYPNKDLPGFLEKNSIPASSIQKSSLLQKMVADGNGRIVQKDADGGFHFNGNFRNSGDLKTALSELHKAEYTQLLEKEEQLILNIFEEVFNHKAFTGRSGTFFGYEGLGSIYWHMVSKLHLAVYETCLEAKADGASENIQHSLAKHFVEVGEGIGIHKDPKVYGAFPTDPYSHTPWHKGAQQPGMTGQVKEDVLVRFGELGVHVEDGKLKFDPFLLSKKEFLQQPEVFEFYSNHHSKEELQLSANTLAFTCCQIPVTYTIGMASKIKLEYNDGASREIEGTALDLEHSDSVFKRQRKIKSIYVTLNPNKLR